MDQEPPTKTPHYDPKTKRISVETTIGVESFKFIASREAWLEAWETDGFLENLSLADVKPFLGRNKKELVQALADLAENHQAIFAQGFLNCVLAANSVNPLYGPATKARGGSPYGFDWKTRNKVSSLALKLNHVLRVMRRASIKDRPAYFRNFHKKYFLQNGTFTKFQAIYFPAIIAEALSDHFGMEFSEYSYETFVKDRRRGSAGPHLTLRRLEKRQCLIPAADPELSEFFAKFQK
jgi:hypothetical protein